MRDLFARRMRWGQRRRLWALSAVTAFALLAVGCTEPPEPAGGEEDQAAMTFTGAGNLSWLNVFVAHDEGIFAEHGIASEVRLFDVGFLGTEAVMAGEAHTAGSVQFPFLGVLAEGADLVVPAVVVKTDDQRIVVDESIQAPEDLAGKRIGLIEGSAFEYAFTRYLDHFGVPRDSVTFVNVDAAEQVAVMARGDIDGFLNVEPVITRAFEALGDQVHVLEPGIETVYTTRILLQMQRSYVEQNEEAVRRALSALIEAGQFIADNPERAAEIGAEWTDIPQEDVARFLEEADFDYTVHYDQEAFDSMAEIAQWMAENGLFTGEPPDYEAALYLDPLREVAPDAVELDE